MKTSSPQSLRKIASYFFGVIFILLSNPTFSQKQVKKISQQWIQSYHEAKLTANFPDRKLILNLGNEIFLNAGKEVTTQVFDLNRLLISPTLQWSKALSISLTWNSQFASTPTPGKYIHGNVSWLQVRHNLDFTPKK